MIVAWYAALQNELLDLTDADLNGTDVSAADLGTANLSAVKLTAANLSGSSRAQPTQISSVSPDVPLMVQSAPLAA